MQPAVEPDRQMFRDARGPEMIPERQTYAPAWYMRNPHTDPDQQVYEEVDGVKVPFILYRTDGATNKQEPVFVTVGMIPLEHRQFIEPDGTMLGQLEFERRFQEWRRGFFQLAEAPVPELGIENIPLARRLLSLGVNPDDESRLIPIGHEKRPEQIRVDTREPIVDKNIGPGWEKRREKKDLQDEEIQRLRAELASRDGDAESEAEPDELMAPCGKTCKSKAGRAAHMRHCTEPGCAPPTAAA